jgi:hypothetical protein
MWNRRVCEDLFRFSIYRSFKSVRAVRGGGGGPAPPPRNKSILMKIKLETYFPVKKKGFNRVRKAVTFITNVECRAEGLYTSHLRA